MFQKLASSRWNLAFVNEDIESILSGKPIHFTKVRNPFADKYWFADPFILDVANEYISVLAEAMPSTSHKGVIALLTISRKEMTITDVEVILEEPWHLSFPNIMHKDGKIYVYPESAHGNKLYLYELTKDSNGKTNLTRVKTLCNDVIWDNEINSFFGEPLLFTAHQNDFNLDIYSWNKDNELFEYFESVSSDQQNMRMAGALIPHKGKIYYPSQISTPYVYGKAVEIREISHINGKWNLHHIRYVKPPKGLLYRGLHTFNTYLGMTIVDIHEYKYFCGVIIEKLVEFKKRLRKLLKGNK